MTGHRETKHSKGRFQLRLYPDPILRHTAVPVTNLSKSVRGVLRGMARIMHDREGIGLAAPQIGIMQRLVVADIGDGLLSLINPEILDQDGKTSLMEGCLSLPLIGVDVLRSESIVVRGINAAGKEVTSELRGLMARVIQHEIDHLDGILIIDHGPPQDLCNPPLDKHVVNHIP